MSKTFTIKHFTEAAIHIPHNISVMVCGEHGIGKSEIIKQLCSELHSRECRTDEFRYLDRRLSQMTEGDLLGLPIIEGPSTKFLPPDFILEACNYPCYLMLDELNRATPGVMAAVFQLALDRELNGYKLHPKTRVYTAINTGSVYTVNDIDPALLDRFWVINLKPSVPEWITWAKDRLHPSMVSFFKASNYSKFLDPGKEIEEGEVSTSRRSWVRLDSVLKSSGLYEQPEKSAFFTIVYGFVGTEAAVAFTSHVKTKSNFTPDDVLTSWSSKKDEFSKLNNQTLVLQLISEVHKSLFEYKYTLDDQVTSSNFRGFVEALGAELRIHLWTQFSTDTSNLALIIQVHKIIGDLVVSAIG